MGWFPFTYGNSLVWFGLGWGSAVFFSLKVRFFFFEVENIQYKSRGFHSPYIPHGSFDTDGMPKILNWSKKGCSYTSGLRFTSPEFIIWKVMGKNNLM